MILVNFLLDFLFDLVASSRLLYFVILVAELLDPITLFCG